MRSSAAGDALSGFDCFSERLEFDEDWPKLPVKANYSRCRISDGQALLHQVE